MREWPEWVHSQQPGDATKGESSGNITYKSIVIQYNTRFNTTMVPTSLNSLPWNSLLSGEHSQLGYSARGLCPCCVRCCGLAACPCMSVQFLANLFQINSVSLRKLRIVLCIEFIYIDGNYWYVFLPEYLSFFYFYFTSPIAIKLT